MILTLNIRQGLIFEADASQSVLPSLPHYHGTYRKQISVHLTGVSEKHSVCPSGGRGATWNGGVGSLGAIWCIESSVLPQAASLFLPQGGLASI